MNPNLKFIVTGTGRSGSVFMARLLTSLGIPCGHESIFTYEPINTILEKLNNPSNRTLSYCSMHDVEDKTSNWVDVTKTVADSSYMAAPYLSLPEIKDIPVIHIVRNPFQVIGSFVNSLNYFHSDKPTNKWENFIYEKLPELQLLNTPLERGAYYYCKWNEMIESNSKDRPYYFSKLEKLDNAQFYEFLSVKKHDNMFNNKKINQMTKNKKYPSINDFPKGSIKDLLIDYVKKYQYPLKSFV